MWVEIDSTPPEVQLDPPQVGTGPYAGMVAIRWRATDPHLAPAPRHPLLAARPAQRPLAADRQPDRERRPVHLDRAADIPPRFHVRIEVAHTVGNLGAADTTETGVVTVNRSRPPAGSPASTRPRAPGPDPSCDHSAKSTPLECGGLPPL